MHLGPISFCDKTGYNIRSDDDKSRILEELEGSFGVRVLKKHHDPFTADTVRTINSNPFMAAVRTNGNPYLLFLTRSNFTEQCVFIDKKVQQGYHLPRMIVTKLWFAPDMFENTLFEGEMVRRNDGSWVFILGDMLADRGQTLMNVNLVRRINRIYEVLQRAHRPDEHDVCGLQVKTYFPVTQVNAMIDSFVPSLPYSCRGIYFKPFFLRFKDVLMNFDDSLVKKATRTYYKDQSNFLLIGEVGPQSHEAQQTVQQTVQPKVQQNVQPKVQQNIQQNVEEKRRTFLVKKGALPDIYELYATPADVARRVFVDALVPNLSSSRALRSMFVGKSVTDTVPLPCTWNERFSKWVPEVFSAHRTVFSTQVSSSTAAG